MHILLSPDFHKLYIIALKHVYTVHCTCNHHPIKTFLKFVMGTIKCLQLAMTFHHQQLNLLNLLNRPLHFTKVP